jgi:hypothetical protein
LPAADNVPGGSGTARVRTANRFSACRVAAAKIVASKTGSVPCIVAP